MGSIKHECIVSNTYISAYNLCSYRKYIFGSCVKKSLKDTIHSSKTELLQTDYYLYNSIIAHSSAEPLEGGQSHHTITQRLRIINIRQKLSLLQEGNWCDVPSIYLDNLLKCISHINTFCPPSSNWNLCKISLYMTQCTLLKSLHCLKELSEPSFRYWMWQC